MVKGEGWSLHREGLLDFVPGVGHHLRTFVHLIGNCNYIYLIFSLSRILFCKRNQLSLVQLNHNINISDVSSEQ